MDELSAKARELEQLPITTLDAFGSVIEKLTSVYPQEYFSYHVDEIVVAALAPSVRDNAASTANIITNFEIRYEK